MQNIKDITRVYLVSVFVAVGFLGISYLLAPEVFADTASTAVTVTNATPVVTNVTLNGGSSITLTENTTTSITIAATVSDGNGCADVFSSGTITAVLYRSGLAATSSCTASDTNCYRSITMANAGGDTCTGGVDTTADASATVPVWYFADPTDASSSFPTQWWVSYVKANDFSNASSSATSTTVVDINSLYALNITASINYGSVAPGADTGSGNQTATTTNTGNAKIDIEFSGTNMSGPATLAATQQKYGTSSVAYASLAYTLSTTATSRDINFFAATASSTPAATSTFWGLAIPNGQTLGSYTGTNTFTAIYTP